MVGDEGSVENIGRVVASGRWFRRSLNGLISIDADRRASDGEIPQEIS